MDDNRPIGRKRIAASFAVLVAVCATILLDTYPHGVQQVAIAGVLCSIVLTVAVGSERYLAHRTASDSAESAHRTSPTPPHKPTQMPLPSLPPRWETDDYWYPAAATRDRTGTRLGGFCSRSAVESMCVEVDNSISAPASARRALQSWFDTVDCHVASLDGALLILSELVTNVVVHTTSNPMVIATFDDHRFRIEVHDHDRRGLVVTPRLAGAVRGLDVVDGLCDLWGWETTAFGKCVWTETLY